MTECTVGNCTNPIRNKTKGWCNAHNKRWLLYGDLREEIPVQDKRPRGLSLKDAFSYHMPGEPPSDGTCWEWTAYRDKHGYGQMGIGQKLLYAHRVAYMVFRGPLSDEEDALHSCHNPPCCNPDHLRPGDQQDNVDDMVRAGRNEKGTQKSGSKLTDDQVREIRETYGRGGISQRKLASQYGVSQMVVSRITRGLIWSHVK